MTCEKTLSIRVVAGTWDEAPAYYITCEPPVVTTLVSSLDQTTLDMSIRFGFGIQYVSAPEGSAACSCPCGPDSYYAQRAATYTRTAAANGTLRLRFDYDLHSAVYERRIWTTCALNSIRNGIVGFFVRRWVNGVLLDVFEQGANSGYNSNSAGVMDIDTPLVAGDLFESRIRFAGESGNFTYNTINCVVSFS